MKGIVDRIEEDSIVIELDNEEIINIERSKNLIIKEGDVVIIEEGIIKVDEEETYKRKNQIEKKFRRLFE